MGVAINLLLGMPTAHIRVLGFLLSHTWEAAVKAPFPATDKDSD